MPIPLSRRVVAMTMLTAAIGISACSSSKSSSSKSAAATTTAAPTTTTPTSTTLDPALRAQLQNALLVPSDVGPGFTSGTYTPGDPTKPEPCGQPNLSTRFPELAKVGAELLQGQTLALTQEIILYSDVPTTDAALAAGLEGVNCPVGTFYASDGTAIKLTLVGPKDVTADVGGGATKAVAYTIKSDQAQGVLIAVEYKQSISTFAFQADPKADTSTAPDPVAVAKKAIAKLAAA